ncbi:MAG: hypothetical protein GY953_11115 [bacterium]|nr:hypothetical protein [bacterium]
MVVLVGRSETLSQVAALGRRGLSRSAAKRRAVREQSSSKSGIALDAVHVLTPGRKLSESIARGLEQSDRNYVCLIRGEPPEDSGRVINDLMRELEAHDADLVGPKTVDEEGRLLSADPYFDSEMMPATAGRLESDEGRFDYVSPAPWLPAAMLLIRRYVFRSIGSFDPTLTGSLQDSDFCLRARSRGLKCLYAGNVTVCASIEEAEAAGAKRRFLDRWSRSPELLYPERKIRNVSAAG